MKFTNGILDYFGDAAVAKNIVVMNSGSELLRLIEVGASCFNHHCMSNT